MDRTVLTYIPKNQNSVSDVLIDQLYVEGIYIDYKFSQQKYQNYLIGRYKKSLKIIGGLYYVKIKETILFIKNIYFSSVARNNSSFKTSEKQVFKKYVLKCALMLKMAK